MRKMKTKFGVTLMALGMAVSAMPFGVNAAEGGVAATIPAGAAEFNGHYYYVFNNNDYTYDQASQFCTAVGGYLATITSQEENDFLFQYMKDSGYQSAYFGLSDAITEGTWVWANGEVSDYTNWSKNEPNAERKGEDYAMFYYKYGTGMWNDGDFGSGTVKGGKAFICEWGDVTQGQAVVPETALVAAAIPANAGVFNGHHYYVFSNKDYTYDQASQFCVAVGGHLATITSQEENDFLFQYMKDSGYKSAYFGFSDAITEGTWVWANGEVSDYTNWSKNEPNAERKGEDYAMFYYKYGTGMWNDGDFGSGTVNGGKAFICEWDS